MKALKKLLLINFGLLFLPLSVAFSCSLMPIDKVQMEDLMKDALASQLNINKSDIPSGALTTPQETFLNGLGADCSGLDSVFFSSAYYFKKSYPNMNCTHRGVIINKGYDLNGQKIVQDSSSCLGIPVAYSPADGDYRNKDIRTRHIKRIELSNGLRDIEVFGACGGGECIWGKKQLQKLRGNKYRATYIQGQRTRILTITVLQSIVAGEEQLSVETVLKRNNRVMKTYSEQFSK